MNDIFTATVDGVERVGFTSMAFFYFEDPTKGLTSIKKNDLTNLTEVKVVPKDAVVIENPKTTLRIMDTIARNCPLLGVFDTQDFDAWLLLVAQLKVQPTPTPAEEASPPQSKIAYEDLDTDLIRHLRKVIGNHGLAGVLESAQTVFDHDFSTSPAEPKGFGAVVEAHLEDGEMQSSRHKFVHLGKGQWMSEHLGSPRPYSDLINPTIIGEGV